jgi:hypothetical protein
MKDSKKLRVIRTYVKCSHQKYSNCQKQFSNYQNINDMITQSLEKNQGASFDGIIKSRTEKGL